MAAYYNEIEPFAAQWLRNLVAAGHIAPGEVDERSIEDVQAIDLRGFTQCHFFAGIGVWSHSLRLAGWPDERPVWTGSCPCQPFSVAGKRAGTSDKRHLWPAWFRLIRECRPNIIFGEQVANAVGKPGSTKVRELWQRQAALRFLQDGIRRVTPQYLQDLQECLCSGLGQEEENINGGQGREACVGGKITSDGARNAVRSGCAMGAGEAGQGHVRGYGNPLRYECDARLEHALAGSNSSTPGIHEDEHQDGVVCGERGLRELGRRENDGSRILDLEEAAREVDLAIEKVGRDLKAESGESWLETVQTDLEDAGYAVGAADLCAASVGAPHIRQRLYWMGVSDEARRGQRWGRDGVETVRDRSVVGGSIATCGVAHSGRAPGCAEQLDEPGQGLRRKSGPDDGAGAGECGAPCAVANPAPGGQRIDGSASWNAGHSPQREPACGVEHATGEQVGISGCAREPRNAACTVADTDGWQPSDGNIQRGWRYLQQPQNPLAGFWRDAKWIACTDGKARPIEPKYVKMVDGAAGGMGSVCSQNNQDDEAIDAKKDDRDCGTELRALREDREAACSPQGRESRKQCEIELGDLVRFLPQSIALAQLHGDATTEKALQVLREACLSEGIVWNPSFAAQAPWQSIGQDAQDRLRRRLGTSLAGIIRTCESPLAHGIAGRVGRLRAYGNSLCAPVAEAFVRAAMECVHAP